MAYLEEVLGHFSETRNDGAKVRVQAQDRAQPRDKKQRLESKDVKRPADDFIRLF
jgi:hypothetical protein